MDSGRPAQKRQKRGCGDVQLEQRELNEMQGTIADVVLGPVCFGEEPDPGAQGAGGGARLQEVDAQAESATDELERKGFTYARSIISAEVAAAAVKEIDAAFAHPKSATYSRINSEREQVVRMYACMHVHICAYM